MAGAKREVAESSFDFLHYSIVDTFSRCYTAMSALSPQCQPASALAASGAWLRADQCVPAHLCDYLGHHIVADGLLLLSCLTLVSLLASALPPCYRQRGQLYKNAPGE